jgi:Zn-dependent metalloprotease
MAMRGFLRLALCAGLVLMAVSRPVAQSGQRGSPPESAIQTLVSETGDDEISINPATNRVRFARVRRSQGLEGRLAAPLARQAGADVEAKHGRAIGFLRRHAQAFGLQNPDTELLRIRAEADAYGGTHLTYAQQHRGVPVFGAVVRTHFDQAGELVVVNGTLIPDAASVSVVPSRSTDDAGRAALAAVRGDVERSDLSVRGTQLLVYREGLAKGVPGPSHLAYEVEVGNGKDVREFVYVSAHSGKVIDRITGIHDDMFRRAYDGAFLPNVPPSYPASPFWVEGDPFPTPSTEANNMLVASEETYLLFRRAFGRDSIDGAGLRMDQIFNRGYQCPNASWNGTFISFCAGFTTDDVTAHEWGHAYTQYTHNLIYQWQSGALNESYSDIWGEVVDRINARGANDPGGPRDPSGAFCSAYQLFNPETRVNSPASIAADYPSGGSAFSPIITTANSVTADVVRPNDGNPGTGSVTDGCCGTDGLCTAGQWANAADVVGKIVLIDRGGACGAAGFAIKALNAQRHGALGVIIANVATSANPAVPANMGGASPAEAVTIPTVSMNLANGDLLRTTLTTSVVNATLQPDVPAQTDPTNRWLMGEDVNAVGSVGALRDMYRPQCFGNPGKVTDTEYFCGTGDNGGVHLNSGVPNHAFALLVDGGTYNGHNIAAIGLTKAAHIYYRAMTFYQTPASNFADHADAIEQSCSDLASSGANLNDLQTGLPSGQAVTAADCAEVAEVMVAVEMRTPPTQCGFQPLLAKNPPARCEPGTTQVNVFSDDFEKNPIGSWTVSHEAVVPADFTPRDWTWANELPDRAGSALFGINFPGGTCAPGGDESGVLHADSPVITLPAGATNPRLTFDHWVATEARWDGGNVKISVNGGPWLPVAPADFTYNAYNSTLFPAMPNGNTNPLAGQPAFTGSDGGAVDGSWGRSHVNIGPYAGPGDTVQLRFDFGQDGCTGIFGWYVDDVQLYSCTSNTEPTITVNDISVAEGTPLLNKGNFTVTLSHPFAEPVTVRFLTLDGTARVLSLDYVPWLGFWNEVTIPPLGLTAQIPVAVIRDHRRENDEQFFLRLFGAQNGVLGDATGVCTIPKNDR